MLATGGKPRALSLELEDKAHLRTCQRLMDAVNMPTKSFNTAFRLSASAFRCCLQIHAIE